MNTLNTMKKNFLVELSELSLFGIIPFCGGLFGIMLSIIIYYLSGKEVYIEMGSFMTLIVGAMVLFFGVAFAERGSFTTAVTMGITRRNYVFSRYVVLLFEILVTFVVYFVVIGLDKLFFPGIEHVGILSLSSINPVMLIVLCLILPVISMFMGIMYVKFDKKFFWFMWAVWMLLTTLGSRIPSLMNKKPDSIFAKIGFFFVNIFSQPTWAIALTAFTITAIVGVITVKLYKTLSITV